jgi:hypothetical protein
MGKKASGKKEESKKKKKPMEAHYDVLALLEKINESKTLATKKRAPEKYRSLKKGE